MRPFGRLLLALTLVAAGLCEAGETHAPSYVGWIPMQCVRAGDELVLDMHRFYNPAPGDRVKLPSGDDPRFTAKFDEAKFELRVAIQPDAKGLIEIPINITNASPKDSRRGEALLTIAVQPPGVVAGNDQPLVFAESQTATEMKFRFVPVAGSDVASVSAVLQLNDGTSRAIKTSRTTDGTTVSTSELPDGSWVRLAIADQAGRVSRVARAQVRPSKEFQWQDGIIYYAFTDRFVNGDRGNDRPVNDPAVLPQANYLGGDFQGIQKQIDNGYFRELGVNVLWLAPLNRNPDGAWKEYLTPYRSYTGYHGYWPVSESEVEPRFGGKEGLENLIASAKKSRIKVIADLVLKHAHVENPLWKEHPDWFGKLELPDGRQNLRLWDEQQFTTWFEPWLPGLDFDNPKPVAFLIANAQKWIQEFGLDGYRLDAVKHIKYSFWPKFRTAMRELQRADGMPDMYFVGETFMDRQGIMSFVGPNMLDGQFDFPLYDTIMEVFARGQKGFAELEASLSASETIYGKETLMSPLIGNHDKSRFMAFADGDLPDPKLDDEEEIGWANPPKVDNPVSYEKLKLAIGFILAIDGVPMVYYGDEVGLTGAGDPDNRRMMPTEDQLDKHQLGVRSYLSKVAALRSEHPALRYGSRRVLVADDHRYAFVRRHFGDSVLAVWNKGGERAHFDISTGPELPDGTYRDVIGGEEITVVAGRTELTLGPLQSAFFVPTPRKTP